MVLSVILSTPHIPYSIIVLSAIIVIHFAISGTKRTEAKNSQKFWEREAEANNTRRADISGLPYVVIPKDTLPFDAALSVDCKREVTLLQELSEKKLLNLSMYTNTDLKAMYGPANLADLSYYDENFTTAIRALNTIGVALFHAGDFENARAFLEFAVEAGSDITETYATLGQLYIETQNPEAFDNLVSKAENLSSLSAPSIKNKLDSIKSLSK